MITYVNQTCLIVIVYDSLLYFAAYHRIDSDISIYYYWLFSINKKSELNNVKY